jgi:hypothetical protein
LLKSKQGFRMPDFDPALQCIRLGIWQKSGKNANLKTSFKIILDIYIKASTFWQKESHIVPNNFKKIKD